MVVLPTPPFWLQTARTRVTAARAAARAPAPRGRRARPGPPEFGAPAGGRGLRRGGARQQQRPGRRQQPPGEPDQRRRRARRAGDDRVVGAAFVGGRVAGPDGGVAELQLQHRLAHEADLLAAAVEQRERQVRAQHRQRQARQAGAGAEVQHRAAGRRQQRRQAQRIEQVAGHEFRQGAGADQIVRPAPALQQPGVGGEGRQLRRVRGPPRRASAPRRRAAPPPGSPRRAGRPAAAGRRAPPASAAVPGSGRARARDGALRGRARFACPQVHAQHRHRRRGDAGDARGLAQGGGTPAVQFLARLERQRTQAPVVEPGRQAAGVVVARARGLGAAAADVALVAQLDRGLAAGGGVGRRVVRRQLARSP